MHIPIIQLPLFIYSSPSPPPSTNSLSTPILHPFPPPLSSLSFLPPIPSSFSSFLFPIQLTSITRASSPPAARALLQRQVDGLEAAVASLLSPVREKFNQIDSGGLGGDAFTEDGFKRAVSMVLSRAFEVMINDDKHLVILPVVDWLNHSDDLPPSSVPVSFDRETSKFSVRAVQNYSPGDHVWITYGSKARPRPRARLFFTHLCVLVLVCCRLLICRKDGLSLTFPSPCAQGAAELLVHYGFCVGPSKHDSVAVSVGADPAVGCPSETTFKSAHLSSSPPLVLPCHPTPCVFPPQNPSSSMALAMLPRALTLGGTTQWVQEIKWSDQVGGKVEFQDEMLLILRVSNCQMVTLSPAPLFSLRQTLTFFLQSSEHLQPKSAGHVTANHVHILGISPMHVMLGEPSRTR